MGTIGGSIWHGIKGARNSVKVSSRLARCKEKEWNRSAPLSFCLFCFLSLPSWNCQSCFAFRKGIGGNVELLSRSHLAGSTAASGYFLPLSSRMTHLRSFETKVSTSSSIRLESITPRAPKDVELKVANSSSSEQRIQLQKSSLSPLPNKQEPHLSILPFHADLSCLFVSMFHLVPKGERLTGSMAAIKARAPVLGGNFGAWGGMFSTFDCAVKGVRQKEDPWNAIIAGFMTGGGLAIRCEFDRLKMTWRKEG
jgi:hypothetical protein